MPVVLELIQIYGWQRKGKKTAEAGYGSVIQKSDRVNEGTPLPKHKPIIHPDDCLRRWAAEWDDERRWNQLFSLFINHSLQPSYYITLSSLIVLSSVCRERLLGLVGRTDWVVVLLMNLINFWVLSGPSKAGMPRSGLQLSQVFCPTRQKHDSSKEIGKKNR